MASRPAPGPVALPAGEARRLEANAEELGVSLERLMERAGAALAAEAKRMAGRRPVLFVCGKGNNGSDGVAAARLLLAAEGDAWVLLAEPASRSSPLLRLHLERFQKERTAAWTGRPERAWPKAALVVDCLLGTGLSGPPKPPYDGLIAWMNRQKSPVLSCDVPSGLGTPAAVRPEATVTFHASKEGMMQANSGRIVVAPIGIPPAAADAGVGDLRQAYRIPRPGSHKGDNGTVLVVAGSIPYLGAPLYNALGAYRTGADLVHLVAPAAAAVHLRSLSPEPIVHDGNPGRTLGPGAAKVAAGLLPRAGCLLLGSGLGTAAATRREAATILSLAVDAGLPVVVDADGLDALDDDLARRLAGRLVVTPHAKEFLDRFDAEATPANVCKSAAALGITILRKAQGTVVSDGARLRHCRRGHPTMTVGGTGDVLAGAVAELLAKGAPPFEAACAASYLVGCAGEEAARLRSWGASALDVAEAIPLVLHRLGRLG